MSDVDEGDPAVLDFSRLTSEVVSAVLVRRITTILDPWFDARWASGPLPIVQPQNETTKRRGVRRTTDLAARGTLVAAQQARVLYGSPGIVRRHRLLDPTPDDTDGGGAVALEVLLWGAESGLGAASAGLVAVHVRGSSLDGVPLIETLRDTTANARRWWGGIDALLPPGLSAEGAVRALHFDDLESFAGQELNVRTRAYGFITGAPDLHSADLLLRAERQVMTIERPDWSALVLRDGAAFIAHQTSTEPFGPTLRTLTHSVYLDALLLAWMQRRMIDRSDDLVSDANLGQSRDLVNLEREYFDFRRRYWRTSLTLKRSSPTDEVFRALQRELLTPDDLHDMEERVQKGAQLARTLQAEDGRGPGSADLACAQRDRRRGIFHALLHGSAGHHPARTPTFRLGHPAQHCRHHRLLRRSARHRGQAESASPTTGLGQVKALTAQVPHTSESTSRSESNP